MRNIHEDIYEVVSKIPRGKVATYGQISKLANSSKLRTKNGRTIVKITPRLAGTALHKNPDPKTIPCHRVVDRNGKLAEKFAFGGWEGQKKRLLAEGIKFKTLKNVDLDKCQWDYKTN